MISYRKHQSTVVDWCKMLTRISAEHIDSVDGFVKQFLRLRRDYYFRRRIDMCQISQRIDKVAMRLEIVAQMVEVLPTDVGTLQTIMVLDENAAIVCFDSDDARIHWVIHLSKN